MKKNINNALNNVQCEKNRKKTEKLSDAIGELSEKIVSDTGSKRKPVNAAGETFFSGVTAASKAKKVWIPLASAAACGVIVLGVVLGSGVFKNRVDENVHNQSDGEQITSASIDEKKSDVSSNMGIEENNGGNNNSAGDKNSGTANFDNGDNHEFGFGTEAAASASSPEVSESAEESTAASTAGVGTDPNETMPSAEMEKLLGLINVQKPNTLDLSKYVDVLEKAEYPDSTPFLTREIYLAVGQINDATDELYEKWWEERRKRFSYAETLDQYALTKFNKDTSAAFLSNSHGKNTVYSPANIYLTLSVLSELTDGESREQILRLTGFDDMEALRSQASALWKSIYCNDGCNDAILANSLWLNSGLDANNDTVNKIANEYFASVFRGDMGSPDTLETMKKWLNDQTGDLLRDSVNGLTLSPETIMTLCSTVYFHGKWYEEFDKEKNDNKIFHGSDGDRETEFMNITKMNRDFFRGEDYAAACLDFDRGAGEMWFILPDEDKTVDDVLISGEFLDMLGDLKEWENRINERDINFSVPKFDVSSDMDVKDILMSLGVEDIFESGKADFSPLLNGVDCAVSSANHAARVVIDEDGCTAAAYTVLPAATGGFSDMEDIDFVLDRPFVFVIVGDSGNVLFMGTVNRV